MKIFFTSLLVLFSFTSCFSESEDNEPEIIYTYNQLFEEQRISWNDIFSFEGEYHVYIYSLGCVHCTELKNDIIEYALYKAVTPIYFVCYEEYIDEIPTGSVDDIYLTIGATSISEIFLGATPSLLGINDHILTFYLCGPEPIRELLEI